MEPFQQTVVNVQGVPAFLHPAFFRSSQDFSAAVSRAVSRVHPPSVHGIAILLTVEDALLEGLAIATSSNEIFILATRSSPILGGQTNSTRNIDALANLLHGDGLVLVGFNMARIAMHIRRGLNCHVQGFEIAEAASSKERNLSPGAFVKNHVDPNANTFAIDTLWDALPSNHGSDFNRLEHLALRAWLTARVSASSEIHLGLSTCIFADTKHLPTKYYAPIHEMLIEVEQMEAAKPRVQQNDFRGTVIDGDGNVVIANDRFNNRVRPSGRTEVWMIDHTDALHRGTARRANGKSTQVAARNILDGISFKAIFVVGKDDFNHHERAREMFLLGLLQGKHDLSEPRYNLLRKLYFPNPKDTLPNKISGAYTTGRLNQSQADAVEAMVHSEAPFIIVHGPPGTGKTSTISVALQEWTQSRNTVWVVAQSNVAVKNIAERLSKDSVKYKLLVSKEFYHEWHEHIYDEQIKQSLIRTDELPAGMQDIAILLHGVKVVLCTLTTLSNPSLGDKNIFNFAPVVNLVVDEASQIGIFNYMHLFAQFKHLNKICFFGDPKQLPPFGKEAASTLKSVFDVRHLKSQAYFLDVQYRMPVPLGNFISNAMYDGKLRSEHKITESSCVAFIDVDVGEEKSSMKSFVNEREVQTVEDLVRYYYRHKNYCVITPYDAQRNMIQRRLEAAGLPFDNIYNVDSFQGNEADYIILSVVRSTSPGFLNLRNRVNVMLTRCRQGLVVVTSRSFMQQRNVGFTLLGELYLHWEGMYGKGNTWHDWRDVAQKKDDLPGISGVGIKADTRSEKSANRYLAGALAVSDSTNRSKLAPVGAYTTDTSIPFGSKSDSARLEAKPTIPLAVTTKADIDSATARFQQMHIKEAFPSLSPPASRSRPFQIGELSTRKSTNPNLRINRAAKASLNSASRSHVAIGAWGNGPPISRGMPSRGISHIRNHSSNEVQPPGQKSQKRWEKLILF